MILCHEKSWTGVVFLDLLIKYLHYEDVIVTFR